MAPFAIPQMAYFSQDQYAQAWTRDLLDATNYRDHADYRREVEQSLRAIAPQYAALEIMPIDVAELLSYAEREGVDPASRTTRLTYVTWLQSSGRTSIPWPPARNEPCWCGSGRKYKKCCGAPAFLAIEPPDPASLVLTITIDGLTPPVWRRVAIPSNTRLDQVHLLFQQALGWDNLHTYTFDTEEYNIVDPRGSDGIRADGERLVSIAAERGAVFTYTYGVGRAWKHTVTLDEIRPGGASNSYALLDGSGTCPPDQVRASASE